MEEKEVIPQETSLEVLKDLIYEIREYQVMLDEDLARIYQVETRRLNQAVKRNIERFPLEFMFQLTKEENDNLKSQFVISSLEESSTEGENINLISQKATSSWGGRRKLPFAFTEHGVIMLSSVLNSKIATQIHQKLIKYILFSVLVLAVIVSGCALLGGSLRGDEVFEGSGQGFRGTVTVQVRMNGAEIVDIAIIDSIEDRFVGEAAMEELIELVIMYNTTDVDAVSGATESSRGFLEAVQNAILKK